MSDWLIYGIGMLAQIFFSGRMILQWILSEKAKKVVSPSIFWILSILASYLLFIYGWIRDDFAIILGQIISYYVYFWNLGIKGILKKIPTIIKVLLLITPVLAIGYMMLDWSYHFERLFRNDDIPLWVVIYGSAGQIIFTLRFIYQWLYSQKRGESVLPRGFWIISLAGSLIIISYAIYRKDPVLILGQSTGAFVYTRNLFLLRNERKRAAEEKSKIITEE